MRMVSVLLDGNYSRFETRLSPERMMTLSGLALNMVKIERTVARHDPSDPSRAMLAAALESLAVATRDELAKIEQSEPAAAEFYEGAKIAYDTLFEWLDNSVYPVSISERRLGNDPAAAWITRQFEQARGRTQEETEFHYSVRKMDYGEEPDGLVRLEMWLGRVAARIAGWMGRAATAYLDGGVRLLLWWQRWLNGK